jgi:hypothetical protein
MPAAFVAISMAPPPHLPGLPGCVSLTKERLLPNDMEQRRMIPSPPSPPSLWRAGSLILLLLADAVARWLILFGLLGNAPVSGSLKGALAVIYILANVGIIWGIGRWLRGRWADGPVRLEQIGVHICFTIMPTMGLMDGLMGKAIFAGMQLLCGSLPLVLGLGLLGRAGSASPSQARRVTTMLGALAVGVAMLLVMSILQEEVPLSQAGRNALFTGGTGLLVLAMWAWGEALRNHWAAARASRIEILGCLSAIAALMGLLTASSGFGAALAAGWLYFAVCGLPFVFGLGLFARAGASAPGRFRRVLTIMLVLMAAFMSLGLIEVLWREMPFSGPAWNAFALGCTALLALPMWLAGRRFRQRWAGAGTARYEAVIGSGVIIAALIAFSNGKLTSVDATLLGLHVVMNSLPFVLGLGLFSRRAA